ncbi:MAG: hypothetical protein HQM07_07850 [Zetaproteobacteria bacterium]|nr:hypothetical protein [Zetaproteobacteria bacterium]
MKSILERYFNQEIGINLEKPFHIETATIVAATDTHFSILDNIHGYTHHFSYHTIVQIIEHPNGVDISDGFLFQEHKHFPMIIKIGHMFEYIPA